MINFCTNSENVSTILDKAFSKNRPRIGLGTGDLFGDGDARSKSARVIDSAFDAGYRYFDTARLYGDGSAEAVLGACLNGKRDQVVLTSKAGIIPWRMRTRARITHKVSRTFKKLKISVPDVPPSELMGAFAPAQIKLSVERSLRELKTDYLDILLLHECTLADIQEDKLLRTLEALIQAGKTRAVGFAATSNEIIRIQNAGIRAPIVQAPNDALNQQVTSYHIADEQQFFSHSSLRPILPFMANKYAEDKSFADQFRTQTSVDPGDVSDLVTLLLAIELNRNVQGVTLFSSLNPERLANQMQQINTRNFTLTQLESAERLIRNARSV